jgi:hypothetical protein
MYVGFQASVGSIQAKRIPLKIPWNQWIGRSLLSPGPRHGGRPRGNLPIRRMEQPPPVRGRRLQFAQRVAPDVASLHPGYGVTVAHVCLGGNLMNQLKSPTGRYNQKGAGRHTLCESCNNKTGRWYAPAYIELARALYPFCTIPASMSAVLQCSIKPVNVLKQIFVMFCSASPPQFAQKHPSLARYLLNPESKKSTLT